MATTTKTLTPTNQTITLPDMTERPNNSIQVDSISKEADATNALSDKIGNMVKSTQIASSSATSHTFTVANNSRHFIVITGATNARCWAGIVVATDSGSVTYGEIYNASSSIFTSVDVSVANKIKFNLSGSYVLYVSDFYVGTPLS